MSCKSKLRNVYTSKVSYKSFYPIYRIFLIFHKIHNFTFILVFLWLKSVWCLMRKKWEMFMKTTTPTYSRHFLSEYPTYKEGILTFKSVRWYICSRTRNNGFATVIWIFLYYISSGVKFSTFLTYKLLRFKIIGIA